MHCVKNTANICNTFCGAPKIAHILAYICYISYGAQKLLQKQTKKIYGNRNICDIFCVSQKFKQILTVFLWSANICDIFCVLQKFAQILTVFLWSAKDTKKTQKRQKKIMASIWRKIGAQSISKHLQFTFTYSHFDSINTIKATELDIHFLQSL